MRSKGIEETYRQVDPREHVLLRPDTYVGSVTKEKAYRWVLRPGKFKFSYEEVECVPALYKIFDEVLVNAADNYQRDHRMNSLSTTIDEREGCLMVENNGQGIPVEIHKEKKMYVPEMIFGHLLTGSNYDDDEKKTVGGRNGYGAKLANIFSTRFMVECGDSKRKRKFKMVWRNNMLNHSEPEVIPYSGRDFTRVTFHPDWHKFGMEGFDPDTVALLTKRVYDMAGMLPKVGVFINDRSIPINSFVGYSNMYFDSEDAYKIRDDKADSIRWQVVVSLSEGEFRQVSFVNSICTFRGGTHVNHITEQIVEKIQEKLIKKDKSLKVKPFQIKNHLWIFVNALIENPTFDSQTKETLTLKPSQFGSKCELTDKLIKEVLKTGVIDEIYREAKDKQLNKMAKMTGGAKKSKLLGIPKLEDANEAGTRNSERCTLILTEGDSAKALAMAGLEVIGRDFYGVFPLKGKLLNVRDVSNKQIMGNQEVQNIMKIVGLQVGKKYEDLKSLRYGSIMIMADQDTDGSHIKGLVINFIHSFWPSLFQMRGFLKQFITPLMKVSKGREVVAFYTVQDYKVWANSMGNTKGWKIKYYKGLGTSTDKEAQEYFNNLERNRIHFRYNGQPDDEAMQMVFCKKNADKRKRWLENYDPDAAMEYDRDVIPYKEFVDRELIHFSNEDNTRSIASIIDGFKPGQRKIIYACFKRNLKEEIKVAQLAGYVAEHSAYHHGEMSLTQTIVNMAQNFVGSNNINLLMPNGQFGSRNQGGKDHASARYIFTNLSRLARLLYPQPDDHSLTYVIDDGQVVEPEFYMPIIPMGLINGCEGIGSGWSTFIPNFKPQQIAEMIVNRLEDGTQFQKIDPWYKGFQGSINLKEGQGSKYEVVGSLEFDESRDGIIHIKELPIGKWTKKYKEFLEEMMTEETPKVNGFREYHTKDRVHFEVELADKLLAFNEERLMDIFKLKGSMAMTNVVGFNKHKKLRIYGSTVDIMNEFYEIRLEFYDRRKEYLLSRLERDLAVLSNKERFILQVVEETLILRKKKRLKIVNELNDKGYTPFSKFPAIKSTKSSQQPQKKKQEAGEEGQEGESEHQDEKVGGVSSKEYNYLLSMPLWNITYQKVEEIQKLKREKQDELIALQKTPIKDLWTLDLKQFLSELEKVQYEEEEERKKGADKYNKNKKKITGAPKRKPPAKKEAKDANKPKAKPKINWDSESDTNYIEQFSTLKESKPKKTAKVDKVKKVQVEKPKKVQVEDDESDIVARVKRKMAKGEMAGESVLIEPAHRTIKTGQNYMEKQSEEFVVRPIADSRRKNKKRMQMDSDSDYGGEDQSDDDDYI